MKKTNKGVAPKKSASKPTKKADIKGKAKSPAPKKQKSAIPGLTHLPADAVEIILESTNVPADQLKQPEQTGREKFLSKLKNEDVYVKSELVSLESLTGIKFIKGKSMALISEGKGVNVVSEDYGYVPNEKFFYEVERHLIEADIKYLTNSTNRNNASFAVDYILDDDSYHVNVKNGVDKLLPMIRFVNTYDGGPCSGTFGFFREVCANGLHVAQTKTGFKVRHIGKAVEIVMPNIKKIVEEFMSNEFYDLKKKFEVLAERPITDLTEFVKYICGETGLFKYEASEKNPETPSAKAKLIIDTINKESQEIGTGANLWLGYNAFNEILHKDKKSFAKQRQLDGKLFSIVSEMAN